MVGLDHYHFTGWWRPLSSSPTSSRCFARYDPNSAAGVRLAPRFVDPSFRMRLGSRDDPGAYSFPAAASSLVSFLWYSFFRSRSSFA